MDRSTTSGWDAPDRSWPLCIPIFGKIIADDTEKWARVIKFSGAKAD